MTIDEFSVVDLRTAKVLEAERVPGSDKLVKLRLSLGGSEERNLVAGIGKAYAPEVLLGRTIVIVANLDPRTFRIKQPEGEPLELTSQGMLLAAHDAADQPVLLSVERDVPPGVRIG